MIRKLDVTDQNTANLLYLAQSQTGCCGSELTVCQYTVANAGPATIEGIKYTDEGEEKTVTLDDLSNGAELQAKYAAAGTDAERRKIYLRDIYPALLLKAGYFTTMKGDITISADLTEIIFTGELALVALINGAGADVVVAETACEVISVCDNRSITTGSATFTVTVAGVEHAIGDFQYPAAGLQAAIEGEAIPEVLGVSVVDNGSAYDVKITTETGVVVLVNDEVTECEDARQEYVA